MNIKPALLHLDFDLWTKIRSLAKSKGMTASGLVRKILQEWHEEEQDYLPRREDPVTMIRELQHD